MNVGAIGCGGTTVYDAAADTYTQDAAGCVYGPNYMSDQLSYAFRSMCGNGEIIARVASFAGTGWAGVAMRESTAAGSKKVQLLTNLPLQLTRREVRVSTNGPAFPQQIPSYGQNWLRIQRVGYSFRMYTSANGYFWNFIGMANVLMPNCIEVGLVSTNFNVNSTSTAVFDNVFITAAAPLEAESVDVETSETVKGFDVYPNPSSGQVTVEVEAVADQAVNLEVVNSLGQPVRNLTINPFEAPREEVDLSGLPRRSLLLQPDSSGW